MAEVKTKVGREEIIIETGKFAKQADGSVTVTCGGTMVLVTCVCSRQAREDAGFFPLTVEYQERKFAAGKIPGGFFKREGKLSEKEILTSRMVDRPIRPLFPNGMLNEVQIIATVLSSDGINDSDMLALAGASAALHISDIPFNGPIASVRVGLIDDEFVINPTFMECDECELELVVAANEDSVIMLEAGANQLPEEKVIEAIKLGHEAIKPIIAAQKKLREMIGKPKREDIIMVAVNEDVYKNINKKTRDGLKTIYALSEKHKRMESMGILLKEIVEDQKKAAGPEADAKAIERAVKDAMARIEEEYFRDVVIKEKRRVDGRKFDEVRKITAEIDVLPRTHGSSLFTRGETQSLSVTTLGTSSDEQVIDALEGESYRSFMLHYNFPPFSVGEIKPMRGPGRREIGHGALAEKALKPMLPSKEKFPYTIRLVSEILESNGSSSMATVCAGSLALMAGGVPMDTAVAGVALGLVKEGKEHAVLTDIAGVEDHYGDMDFKVAGTKDGVTAVQMDLKIHGIDYNILKEAFECAKKGRLHILGIMNKTISEAKKELAENAPRIVTIKLRAEKIRDVIGPGGKVIKRIIAETGADINIDDDGSCQVASCNKEALQKALNMINDIIAEAEVGKIYEGEITRLMNFGAFCRILPGVEGLIHVSELAEKYVKDVREAVKEGQHVTVKCIEIDEQHRVNLSIKQAGKDQNQDQTKDQDKAQG